MAYVDGEGTETEEGDHQRGHDGDQPTVTTTTAWVQQPPEAPHLPPLVVGIGSRDITTCSLSTIEVKIAFVNDLWFSSM